MEGGPHQPRWPPPEAPPGPGGPAGPPYYAPAAGWQPPPPVYAGLELASWGSRAAAWVLDVLVVTALWLVGVVPGIVLLAATSADAAGIVLLVLGAIVVGVLAILYAPFFMRREGEHNGQTLGKQWVGIRVVRVNGEPMGWGWALLRELVIKGLALGVVSVIAAALTFFVLGVGVIAPALADYLWPLWDDQSRAVHDMIAETRVVRA